VDALLVIFTPVDARRSDEILEGIREGVARHRREQASPKTVLACLMAPSGHAVPAHDGDARLPSYRFPENAVRALARIVRYAEWRAQPPGVVRSHADIAHARLRALCDRTLLERGDTWLPPDEVGEFLSACGIANLPTMCAGSGSEAAAAAEQLGYPVALKLHSPLVLHKSDIGGVRLNLADGGAVAAAFDTMTRAARESLAPGAVEGVVVQPMAPPGVEVIVGVARDPLFGALIGFGIGGTAVELLGDMHFRVAPLSERDIDALFHETRLRPMLTGYRGRPGADLEALRDLIARLSEVADRYAEIAEIDLNPVIAHPPGSGYVVADARIRLTRRTAAATARPTRAEC
jgi:acetyltransferase